MIILMFLLFPKMVVTFPYMDNDNFDVFTIVKSGCCIPYMDNDNFDVFTIPKNGCCISLYG